MIMVSCGSASDDTILGQNCQCCKTVTGSYTDPKPPQGSVSVNNHMDLLCLDFMKVDPSENG